MTVVAMRGRDTNREALEACEAEEGAVGDPVEPTVPQLELLQPDQAPEALGVELTEALAVTAPHRQPNCQLARDHSEVGALGLAVDGGEGALEGQPAALLALPEGL